VDSRVNKFGGGGLELGSYESTNGQMGRMGVPYLELFLIWNIFDRYTIGGSSSYMVLVLLEVILQGFK
jgi:hypothetical protein